MESTMKSISTDDYTDMCLKCYSTVQEDIPVLIREDLAAETGTDFADYIETSYD
jgi:hypothetical protein